MAIVDILLGLWALYDIVTALLVDHINLNLTVLLLIAGGGLLLRSNAWRFTLRIMHAISIGVIVVGIALSLGPNGPLQSGLPTGALMLAAVLSIAWLAFFIWGFVVLGREDVRRACGWPRE